MRNTDISFAFKVEEILQTFMFNYIYKIKSLYKLIEENTFRLNNMIK